MSESASPAGTWAGGPGAGDIHSLSKTLVPVAENGSAVSPNPSSRDYKNLFVLSAIVVLAFLLRVYGIATLPYNYDEPLNIQIIRSIDPGSLSLPFHSFQHTPLSVYVLKIGTLLFGENDFGFRVANVAVGSLTCLVVYALAVSGGLGRHAAWLAALMLATNRFHIGWSRLINQEALYLGLAALTLVAFWRLYRDGRGWWFAGTSFVLAVLAKEAAVLLLVPLSGFFLVGERGRALLRRRRREVAGLLAAVAVVGGLLLVYSLRHPGTNQTNLAGNLGRLATIGYKVEPLEFFLTPSTKYDAPLPDTWTYPYMFWGTGVILLASVAWSFRRRERTGEDGEFVRLMLAVFSFYLLFFSFFGSEAATSSLHRGEYWWCDVVLFPAIVLAARLLVRFRDCEWLGGGVRAAFLLFPVYLLANALFFVAVTKNGPILERLGITYTDVVTTLPWLF